MNALIDVCLVLLVFFILTTSYAALQKRLEAPSVGKDKSTVTVLSKTAVDSTIKIQGRMENGKAVVLLEGKPENIDALPDILKRYARDTRKTTLLLDYDNEVAQDIVVRVIDAAKGAGVDKVQMVVP